MSPIDIAQQKYDNMEPDEDDDEFFDSDFDEPDYPEPDEQACFERSP